VKRSSQARGEDQASGRHTDGGQLLYIVPHLKLIKNSAPLTTLPNLLAGWGRIGRAFSVYCRPYTSFVADENWLARALKGRITPDGGPSLSLHDAIVPGGDGPGALLNARLSSRRALSRMRGGPLVDPDDSCFTPFERRRPAESPNPSTRLILGLTVGASHSLDDERVDMQGFSHPLLSRNGVYPSWLYWSRDALVKIKEVAA
jgi:hypothetical protein